MSLQAVLGLHPLASSLPHGAADRRVVKYKMNGASAGISPSRHAGSRLFECLIVAGALPLGCCKARFIGDAVGLQKSLELIRDMWRRADTLHDTSRTWNPCTGRSAEARAAGSLYRGHCERASQACQGVHDYPARAAFAPITPIPTDAAEPRLRFGNSRLPLSFPMDAAEQQRRSPSRDAHGEQRKAPEQQHLPQQQQQVQLSLSPRTDSGATEYHATKTARRQKHARRLQQLYPPLTSRDTGESGVEESKSLQTRGGKSERVAPENGTSGCYDSNDERRRLTEIERPLALGLGGREMATDN
ncbi:hypothetical protein Q5P01_000987 [Channa striata]|uniref:Uncharacterized protein n=1 Tax=Channa striata TaxID=64152 RepID=A0AA88IR46_CHASR|nr:hypothetical protein Q5P01_000987 [Channa striata]